MQAHNAPRTVDCHYILYNACCFRHCAVQALAPSSEPIGLPVFFSPDCWLGLSGLFSRHACLHSLNAVAYTSPLPTSVHLMLMLREKQIVMMTIKCVKYHRRRQSAKPARVDASLEM